MVGSAGLFHVFIVRRHTFSQSVLLHWAFLNAPLKGLQNKRLTKNPLYNQNTFFVAKKANMLFVYYGWILFFSIWDTNKMAPKPVTKSNVNKVYKGISKSLLNRIKFLWNFHFSIFRHFCSQRVTSACVEICGRYSMSA